MGEEKSVLRWGGIAGLLAGIFFVGFMIMLGLVPAMPSDPAGLIMRFPDVKAAITTRSGLGITSGILSIALLLALYHALRGTGRGAALFGSVLGVLGLVATALAFTSVFVAFAPLSDLYHAPGATPEEQATALLLGQATLGIVDTFFFLGNLFLMVGLIALGVAMLRTPAFGKGFGGVSVVLGVAGAVGQYATVIVPAGIGAAIIANLIFLFLFGWKVYSLSKVA